MARTVWCGPCDLPLDAAMGPSATISSSSDDGANNRSGSASQPVVVPDGSGSASQPAVLASGGASEPVALPKAVRDIGESSKMSKAALKASQPHFRRRIHKKSKPFATPRPQLSRPIPSRPIPVSDGSGSASQPVAKDGEAPWCYVDAKGKPIKGPLVLWAAGDAKWCRCRNHMCLRSYLHTWIRGDNRGRCRYVAALGSRCCYGCVCQSRGCNTTRSRGDDMVCRSCLSSTMGPKIKDEALRAVHDYDYRSVLVGLDPADITGFLAAAQKTQDLLCLSLLALVWDPDVAMRLSLLFPRALQGSIMQEMSIQHSTPL